MPNADIVGLVPGRAYGQKKIWQRQSPKIFL